MQIANKTELGFDPLPEAVAVDVTGTPVYTTPSDHRPTLADLARLSYLSAVWRYTVTLNQASAAGAATLKLSDGNTVLASDSIDLSAAQRFTGRLEVDLASVNGGARLRLELDVGSEADADTTAQVAAALEVEHPLVITAGCG